MFMLAVIVIAVNGAFPYTIHIDICLAAISDPPSVQGYSAAFKFEADFISCLVAEQHIVLHFPFSLGHTRTLFRNGDALVKNEIGERGFECQWPGLLQLELNALLAQFASTVGDILFDIVQCLIDGFLQSIVGMHEKGIFDVTQYLFVSIGEAVIAFNHS